MTKIKNLLGSIRFWLVTVVAIIAIFHGYASVGTLVLTDILTIIEVWLGAIVGIGTLDSVATKFGLSVGTARAKK